MRRSYPSGTTAGLKIRPVGLSMATGGLQSSIIIHITIFGHGLLVGRRRFVVAFKMEQAGGQGKAKVVILRVPISPRLQQGQRTLEVSR